MDGFFNVFQANSYNLLATGSVVLSDRTSSRSSRKDSKMAIAQVMLVISSPRYKIGYSFLSIKTNHSQSKTKFQWATCNYGVCRILRVAIKTLKSKRVSHITICWKPKRGFPFKGFPLARIKRVFPWLARGFPSRVSSSLIVWNQLGFSL